MNHIYRVVFNPCQGIWQAVCECATGRGKSGTKNSRTVSMAAPLMLALGTLSAGMACAHITIGTPELPSQQTDVTPGLGGSSSDPWHVGGPLTVGNTAQGLITIDNGSQVTSTDGVIGQQLGSSGMVNLEGTGSSWHNSGTLYVGAYGNGTVNIGSGAEVSSTNAFVGREADAVGVVNVSGSNAQWTNSQTLIVGEYGKGTVNIGSGAHVSNTNALIGRKADAVGEVNVSGSNAQWTNSDKLIVGDLGSGTLHIQDGGTVSSLDGFVGNGAGSKGHASVSGANSQWNTGRLFVGNYGNGALLIENGGSVSSANSVVGNYATSTSSATVSGVGSTWTSTGLITIGNGGNGELHITDGGQVSDQIGAVGTGSGGIGQVTVDGEGSRWDNASSLRLGDNGTGTLDITNGATVTATSVLMAQNSGGTATLELHGNANDGRGVLETGQIIKGDGTATLNLDGGILRATADQADFLSGFDTLTLGAGGAIIDTNQHDIGLNTTLTSVPGQDSGLTKQGQGSLTLGQSNTYTGATVVEQGVLRAGADNVLSSASIHTVDHGASLDLAGFDQTIAGLHNSGMVNLSGSAPGTTLTVTGNYVGNDGHLGISTELNGNDSATDRLVISGPGSTASGHTTLHVTNAGGLGAQTSGNGIQIVGTENGASLEQDAFSLAGGHVDAGAFEYYLVQDAQGASLHSYNTTELAYREEVPLISALPAQLRQSELAMLGDMRQRISSGLAGHASDSDRRAWGRILRIDPKSRQQGSVSSESSGHLTGFQAGLDLYADKNLNMGFYVGQMEGDMGVHGFVSGVAHKYAGFNKLRSRYLGAYGTWHNESGLYADAVVQGASHRSHLHTASSGRQAGVEGNSWLASLEVGQSFALSSNWQIQPQAQLIYSKMSLDDTALQQTDVKHHTKGDWTMRLGARMQGRFTTSVGLLQPYGRISIQTNNAHTDVASFIAPAATTDIRAQNGHTSTELALGAALQVSPQTSLYGELSQLISNGGDMRLKSGLQAMAGVRALW